MNWLTNFVRPQLQALCVFDLLANDQERTALRQTLRQAEANPGEVETMWGTIGGKEQALRANVGAVIMVGTLLALIPLIFGLVLRYDPEAGGLSKSEHGDG